jgi:exonuclease SbcC
MKLLELKLNNFLSYADETIPLHKAEGVSFLIGKIEDDADKSNGAGKSAIWDAVDWCLFGNSRVNDDDGLIRLGASEMIVGLKFELDGKTYSVYRTKKRSKSQTLAFTDHSSDNADISYRGNSVKETQQKIVEILGMDAELYGNTVFSRQGKIDEFPRQLPSKRKDMLRNILKINEYEIWANEAKELAGTYENQYTALKVSVDQLLAEINSITATDIDIARRELSLSQIRESIQRTEIDITNKRNEYNSLKATKQVLDKEFENNNQLNDDINRVKKQLAYIESHEKEELDKILKEKEIDAQFIQTEEKIKGVLAEIVKKLTADETSQVQYSMLKQQEEMLEGEMKRLYALVNAHEAMVVKMRAKLDTFRDLKDKCPVCNSVLTEEQRQVVEAEIIAEGKAKKEYYDKLQDEYESAKSTANKLREELKGISINAGRAKELDRDKTRYEAELVNIQIAKNRIEYVETKLSDTRNSFIRQCLELKFELERKTTDFERSIKTIEGYKSQLSNVEKLETEIGGLDEIRQTYAGEERKMIEDLHRFKYELETKKKKEMEVAMSKVKIDKAKQDYFIYTELTNAFGKDGIPLLVIENALAELQSEVQRQLEIMTDGAVMVEFRTQKELKSGKMSDTLDILVSDREGIRDFNLYSGGERMRVALAIRLGLSKLLSRRAGKRFDILIIDEISDLDIHGMGKFVELIHQVAQDYKQIFVVSHIDELKDRFQQVIQVVKDKNGSKVFM